MRNDEVLAARLTDNARIGSILRHARTDCLPHVIEDTGAACEMHSCEIRMTEELVGDCRGVAGYEIDHTRWKSGFLEQLHYVIRREHRARRRLPYDSVSHKRGSRRKISGNRREVERRNCVNESFQRTIVELIPHRVIRDRLLIVQLLRVARIETPEVD